MKYNLQDMSWVEVQETLERTDTVIVPIGNLEQHGPHSPVAVSYTHLTLPTILLV